MKRIWLMLSVLFLNVLFALQLFAGITISAPSGFDGEVWNGAMALYGEAGPVQHFLCTAFPIAKIDGGYRLMSAGHCVQLTPNQVSFAVADNIGAPLTPVTIVKAYLGKGIDFSLFDLKTTKTYPVFQLATDVKLRIGDRVINPNFAKGLGKQISYGRISSGILMPSEECSDPDDDCLGNFMVQIFDAPGASGSPVISEKSHTVIGIVVVEFDGANIGLGIEPISKYQTFLTEPSQPRAVEGDDQP